MNNIYSYLSNNIKTNGIVVECGGHRGYDTIGLANLFKDGIVHSLEANKKLFTEYLVSIKKDYPNVIIHNICLADKNGHIDFFIDNNKDGDSGASSILESTTGYLINYIKKEDRITIPCTTLKNFMDNNGIMEIELLWLDIEGYEYYVLKESEGLLKSIKYIYTEVNFQEFRKNGKRYDDIAKLLGENGFVEVMRWEQGDVWGKWQGNVLFKNKN